jgi:hypothetical protein
MITQTTLRPGQKGTKRLEQKYGDRLICVRYKLDRTSGRRFTTVELIESEIAPQPSTAQQPIAPSRRLAVRVEYWETDLRDKVKAAGGIWRPRQKLWELRHEDIVTLGLEARVVPEEHLVP